MWLGAYKPRMLQLTGRRADGWLPSLSNLQPGDLAKGNATIDDAAQEAGRSPRTSVGCSTSPGSSRPPGAAR
ncbi:LLM class flavin-dependent oxidoreductase [Micromonospora sp. M12]